MKSRSIPLFLMCLLVFITIGTIYYAWKAHSDARIVVEWSTASELDTVGFNIYRSDTLADPGTLVNMDLIPAADDTQTGSDYLYTDVNVDPGRVYYYYLEDVSQDGTVNRHGPVQVQAQSNGAIIWIIAIGLALVFIILLTMSIWIARKPPKNAK